MAVKNVRDNGVEEEVRTSNDYGYEFQRFFSYYRPEEIKKYFEDVGLEIVWENSKKTGNCEWLQIIKF
ncbi:MAG: hypothetical protein UX09_C0015G0018 [Candidatus Uhrbacteria bacterium GW2011_GWE2_45_35]|uniref:Uncharacterized protein n=2 Tax=Candidatus Uhriibacteriota TaxID=1752732 RepID=A0A0G1LRI3_9BACT|nr:MAG: hypothetical protein UW63_C0017G0022 [Candidatus Uhrbacteria bacterium GW2011_GWF2_44_350]KKU08631.1 MAG: hypothetical protein UX09_C0015G0018 [Candidatus Uhrbacteria bacterium GW2011_GWE2_45_35]HBR80280.1 hypothetical protein [Candidatus Uhrbacteria bacterium]HCU31582.1 hypothetical protein [Candidatus Uhrbacteria bacterium]